MDHVDLTPYPFPDGVHIPRLMPYQEYPWNGDGYLAAEVIRLKETHGLVDAIETGTCLGSTTCWLAEQFGHVNSFEINSAYLRIAAERIDMLPETHNKIMATLVEGSSAEHLAEKLDDTPTFIFLDAHWAGHCPLLNELELISLHGPHCCILIHDFQVPGTDFGFDKMPDGRPFNLALIRPYLDAIYGEGGWKHNYPTKVEGARRGWISIEPLPAPASPE